MAVIFPFPTNVPEAASTGYQRQNTLFYAQMTGHFNLSLSNMNNSSEPAAMAGSVFEVNGGLFKVTADEAVSGSPSAGQNYIYAVPNEGGASFTYSATKPAWDYGKCGWYNGNSRAVAKAYYVSGQYNNKVVLDSYGAMDGINKTQKVPSSGGNLVLTGTVNQVITTTLEPGMYRFEIKAGNGGAGGEAYPGGSGAQGQSKVLSFIFENEQEITFGLGGDGENGGDTYSWGAGGGCSGGSSFIVFLNKIYLCVGGSGGGGGYGIVGGNGYRAGGGGGGAGGYGTGQDGQLGENGEDFAGHGGSNGVGGAGGRYRNGTSGGGGGSGHIQGGVGGLGSIYDSENDNGKRGGSYGYAGGNGGYDDGIHSEYIKSGIGGASMTGEYMDPVKNNGMLYNFRIQWQGGGGGGYGTGTPSSGAAGGDGHGGGALKSYSSGYLRIYRLA
jgi:hypothetical protein